MSKKEKTKIICFRLPRSTAKEFEDFCSIRDYSVSEVLQNFVERTLKRGYIEEEPLIQEIAKARNKFLKVMRDVSKVINELTKKGSE